MDEVDNPESDPQDILGPDLDAITSEGRMLDVLDRRPNLENVQRMMGQLTDWEQYGPTTKRSK